jgi:phage baseplate assembly protein W
MTTSNGARFFGYNLPFLSGRTLLPFQADHRLITNDILQLLLTVPGERVMRPTFGSPIKMMLFEGATRNSLDSIRNQIFRAITTNEKRVTVGLSDISVTSDRTDNHTVNISIRCRYEPGNEDNSFLISFNINPETGQAKKVARGVNIV